MKNINKIFLSATLITAIFGSQVSTTSKNTSQISKYKKEIDNNKESKNLSYPDGGAAQGGKDGVTNMQKHNEDTAVLDEWFEYYANNGEWNYKVVDARLAINYNLNKKEDGSQEYILGFMFDPNIEYTDDILNDFSTEEIDLEVYFNSKYWASWPINGLNRMDEETLKLDPNIKYHAATLEDVEYYNARVKTGYEIEEGDIMEISVMEANEGDQVDPNVGIDGGSVKYVADGIPEGEEWRNYGDIEEYVAKSYTGSTNGNGVDILKHGQSAAIANSVEPNEKDLFKTTTISSTDPIFHRNVGKEEWNKYFSEDETTLYSAESYDAKNHFYVEIPMIDSYSSDPYLQDNFGLSPSSNNPSIKVESEPPYTTPIGDEFEGRGSFYLNGISPKDALSIKQIRIYVDDYHTPRTSTHFSSKINHYSTTPDEEGNEQILLSYPNPKFEVDVKGYDENNDFIVDVTYDHTPTQLNFSIVNYVEYTMMGPTTTEGGEPVIWDQIRIGDGWATRETRNSLDDPTTTIDENYFDKLPEEWKDGDYDINSSVEGNYDPDENHIGGYPEGMELPDYDGDGVPDSEYKGDMEIGGDKAITQSINYGDLFYGDSSTDEDMKYTFTSKISVTPTELGSDSAFLPGVEEPVILSYYDEKLILTGPSKPIVETFEVNKSSSWNPDDAAPLDSMEITFSGDVKTESEVEADNHIGLRQTGQVSVKVVAYEYEYTNGLLNATNKIDLSDETDVSADTTYDNWTIDENGSFTGVINTNEGLLNPNSNYILALEWVYGEGTYSNPSNYLIETTGFDNDAINTDGMFTIKTSSIGDRDVSLTNNTITGIPTPDWGAGDWSLTYTFDYDQVVPADHPVDFEDSSFYDRRTIENFEIVNNAGTENEKVIITKTPEEVKPGFDSMEETPYEGLTIDIPATSLYPDTAYELTVRANTIDGDKFDSTPIHVDPIDGPPATAPVIETVVANEYYFDKDDREIHADIDFSIDAVTTKEAIDSSWTMGPSNIQEVQIINTADDSILASTDGASLNVDENSDGKVNGTITLDGLDANTNYSLELNIVYGAKNESDSAPVSQTFELTTGSRGQAAIEITDPVVEGLTTKSGFSTTATTTLTPMTIGSYDINDFDLPEISSLDLVEYDVSTEEKVGTLASTTDVTFTDLTSPVDVTIDVPSIEYNSNYKIGVVANMTDDNTYKSGNIDGLTDNAGPAEPIVKDLMVQEAEGDKEHGYSNTIFEFEVKTQIYDGIDNVDTSATNLTALSLTLFDQDGKTIIGTEDLSSSIEKPSDKDTFTQEFVSDSAAFKDFKFEAMGYNYEIDYTYGGGLNGKQEGVIEFEDHGIESLESNDITITDSKGMQTGFKISGDINNKPVMFYSSYSVKELAVLDQDGNQIDTVEYKLFDSEGSEITDGNGIIPSESGETNGSFELTTFGILPSTNVIDYSIQIITDENTYSQKLKDIEGVLNEDGSSFVNSDDTEHEVIDDLKVGFDTPKNLVIDKENAKATFDISFINETSLKIDEESIALIDQNGTQYTTENDRLIINDAPTRDANKSVTVLGLENGVDYDFKISYDLTDASMEGYSTDTTFTFTQELGSISMPKLDEGISTGAIVGIVIGCLFLLILLPLLLLLLLLLFVAWSARLTSQDGKKASFTTNKKFEKYGELLVGRTLTINDEQYKFKTSENEKGYIVIEISNFNIEKTISKFIFTKDEEKDIKVNVLNKSFEKKEKPSKEEVEENDNLETLTKKELMDIATETYEADSLKGYTKNDLVKLLRNDGIKVPAKNAKANAK